MNFLLPLSITLALETGIYMILKHKDLKLFIVVTIMNLILNPMMNLILLNIPNNYYWLSLSLFEIATVFIESLIVFLFLRKNYAKTLLFAFLANLLSFAIGLSLFFLYETKIAIIVVTSLFFIVYFVTFGVVFSSFLSNYYDRHNNRSGDNSVEKNKSH